jgi:type II secretory pathway pseudopilin PulG
MPKNASQHFYCLVFRTFEKIKKLSFNNESQSKMKSCAGFTLAEALIVIAILVALFPMVITNYNAGEKQFSLYRSAHGLAQELRNTQEMAMAGKRTPVQFGQNFPAGGYGLYFETYKNSYILFADCDGDNKYDESGSPVTTNCSEATPDDPYPEKIKEIFLEPGVIISSIIPSDDNNLSILFFPPTPVIKINPLPSNNQAIITLELAGRTKTITINSVGLIDVD